MSKKYKDKLCVYCTKRQSVTGDHIFAREFFLLSQRANLPKAPTCEECNSEKSKIEHYLTALLPFGGRHPDAHDNLTELLPPRLAKNVKLHRNLSGSRTQVMTKEEGSAIYQTTTALPINPYYINQLFVYIVKGLTWYHWKTYLTDDCHVEVLMLSSAGQEFFEQRFFKLNVGASVKVNLGNRTICYEGIQAKDCTQITVWRFDLYGGLVLTGDPRSPQEISTQIAAISGHHKTFQKALQRYKRI